MKDFGPNEAYSSPTEVKGQKNQVKCVQTSIEQAFIRLRNRTHWNQTLYPQWSRHCGNKAEPSSLEEERVRFNRVDQCGEKIGVAI